MGRLRDFAVFIRQTAAAPLRGGRAYWAWIAFLSCWIAAGAFAYAHQARYGLSVTGLCDQVTWGAYIANFTFLVGAAAAAVMLVIPAYLYHDAALKEVVVLGELLAMSALVMCLLFVNVDMGRPDRFWHLLPIVGRFNWPISLLSWDVIVLLGYLAINSYLTTYVLFCKFRGRAVDRHKYRPIVYLAIPWAVGIHTVTAFLYSGLGGRPHWNSAVLAPRFLASAFAAGPALLIIALVTVRDRMGFPVKDGAIARLRQIAAVAMVVNLFLFASEVFTELYPGTVHSAGMRYDLFGLPGARTLVPYTWTGVALDVFAALTFAIDRLHRRQRVLLAAAGAAVVGVWIEKGMGLVIPGFVPSPLGEVVEYVPTIVEFAVSAGIWAVGALVYTVLLKIAVPIELGRLTLAPTIDASSLRPEQLGSLRPDQLDEVGS
jgi:Ni/Fe-hydrogenase subunit HybB-like protein